MKANPTSRSDFDVFVSYATQTDIRLARHLKSFIGSFHKRRTAKQAHLPERKVCLDETDFVGSAESSENQDENHQAALAKVDDVIQRGLAKSRQLLVLCSSESMQSSWVRSEIRFFLERYGPGRVLLALTHGTQAEESPETFFAPELVEAGLHESIWYDLRGFYRSERRGKHKTPRDFDSERLRLVASLHGKPPDAIETLWAKEQRRAAEIRYGAGATVAVIMIALGSALFAQWRVAAAEKARANVETSMRYVSQAYRHRFSDPFSAAADAHRSTLLPVGRATKDESASAFEATHQILVERRRIAHQERIVVKTAEFSFIAQESSGQRFTKLSHNGERILVVTERRGDAFSPEVKGDAYVLNNQTLEMVELAGCPASTDYRLEFAGFVGVDKVLIARAFHVDLYTVKGQCLGSFQLQHTKTPVTAANGMLHDVFFVAGNGAGCVWVEEYGNRGLIKPDSSLSAVANCDEKLSPNALVEVLVDPQKRVALNLFQSGRVDIFALDGNNGRPRRRPVMKTGAYAAAFQPGADPPSFAVAFADSERGGFKLARWDMASGEPSVEGNFSPAKDNLPIDYLGFSADGDYLIGLDSACGLHLWNYGTRDHTMMRSWQGGGCD